MTAVVTSEPGFYTLVDALMAEIRRVRDVLMPRYIKTGVQVGDERSVLPALTMMRVEMDAAIMALAEQDATKCLAALDKLRGFTE